MQTGAGQVTFKGLGATTAARSVRACTHVAGGVVRRHGAAKPQRALAAHAQRVGADECVASKRIVPRVARARSAEVSAARLALCRIQAVAKLAQQRVDAARRHRAGRCRVVANASEPQAGERPHGLCAEAAAALAGRSGGTLWRDALDSTHLVDRTPVRPSGTPSARQHLFVLRVRLGDARGPTEAAHVGIKEGGHERVRSLGTARRHRFCSGCCGSGWTR
eukprot:5998528-Prymnesium_polylepis.2